MPGWILHVLPSNDPSTTQKYFKSKFFFFSFSIPFKKFSPMRWLCLMALAAAAAQTTGAFLVPPDCAYGPPRCTPLDTEAAVTQAANTEEEFCVCQPTTTEPRIVAAARGACYVPGLRTAYRHALPQPEGSARSAAACAPMLVERRKCRRQVPCPGAAAGHSGSRAARDAGDGSTGGTLSASTSSSDDDDVWQIPLLGVFLLLFGLFDMNVFRDDVNGPFRLSFSFILFLSLRRGAGPGGGAERGAVCVCLLLAKDMLLRRAQQRR